MKKLILVGVAVACLAGAAPISKAWAADDHPSSSKHQHWMEQRAALFDARLAGFKAGLKLTADQEKNWSPFETALRDIAKSRAERFREHEQAQDNADQKPSPIDRMRGMSNRLAKRSVELQALADAASPLYASLDDDQKHIFGPLFGDFVRDNRHGHHHRRERER